MINANELRIGNFFIEEKTQTIIEVIGLEKNRVVFSGKFLNEWQAKPIPLTEYWLIRFNIFKADGYPHKLLVGYLKCRNGFYFFKYYELEIELQFVHQLQNLYQCLTGQELEVSK